MDSLADLKETGLNYNGPQALTGPVGRPWQMHRFGGHMGLKSILSLIIKPK